MNYGGIEAGGTKWVCAIGTGGTDLRACETFPTTTPSETLARAVGFFRRHEAIDALGIGSFGPVDIRTESPTWGQITTTTKPGWDHVDVVSALARELDVEVALDTDVNAAALAESRWGAGRDLEVFCYITIGTGIGGGVFVDGRVLHGVLHPELGHMRIPHDRERDPFSGGCPYHGDCFEGLASGSALRARWGMPAEQLSDPAAWDLEAKYVALGLANVTCVLAPQRIVLGGGVATHPGFLPDVRTQLQGLLAGYMDVDELTDHEGIEQFVVAPGLGDRAGVIGAIELAAVQQDGGSPAGSGAGQLSADLPVGSSAITAERSGPRNGTPGPA